MPHIDRRAADPRIRHANGVMPAKAGTQYSVNLEWAPADHGQASDYWVPAFAGMTPFFVSRLRGMAELRGRAACNQAGRLQNNK
jgi:hypothetical protein